MEAKLAERLRRNAEEDAAARSAHENASRFRVEPDGREIDLDVETSDPLGTNGGFWLDRRRRPIHRLPGTRRSDTPDRRARLWSLIATLASCQDPWTGSD